MFLSLLFTFFSIWKHSTYSLSITNIVCCSYISRMLAQPMFKMEARSVFLLNKALNDKEGRQRY